MKRAALVLVLVASALAQLPEQTPTPPTDPKIVFKVSLVERRNEFRMGEIIPIKFSFSSRIKDRYELDEAQYDRGGRMDIERFIVTPVDGAVDPLADFQRGMGGGLRGFGFLKQKPWTIQLNLNEWIRFTKPGEYKVKVASSRVEKVDSASPYGKSPVTAISNEFTLKILPRDPDWEKRVVDEAVATLKSPSSLKKDARGNSAALHALETLRFLGTPDATRALANELQGQDRGNLAFDCYIGLVTSPERAFAREAVKEKLAEPDRPIGETFINTLVILERRNTQDEAASTADEQKVLEEVARVLPDKRGEALPVSLYSLLNYFWIRGGKDLLPKDTVDRLVEQLIAVFDQLTAEQQASLLDYRWKNVKRPALLPLLKRYGQQEFSDGAQDDRYAKEFTALAIRRWFELDPVDARPAIISEICRPKPRFGVRELGMLPDQTLPEVDQLLIEHLRGNGDFQSASNLASLIARYATRAILPQVLQKLDPNIGKWACDVQSPLLAYVLRVDSDSARSRIERAIASRGEKFTRCNHSVLQEISAIHFHPFLEEIAIRALDDPDHEVATGAAMMLAGFGSGAAEAVLWQHYERWCKRWLGRERQVNLKDVEVQYAATTDLGLGKSFVRAIVSGKTWLTDEPKLQRLRAMSKVPTIQYELDLNLEKWRPPGPSLSIFSCAPEFSAHVAQYDFNSFEDLKEKLSQFARGTKFVLSLPFDKTDRSCLDDLRAFLATHGFSVTASKEDEGN